MRMCSMEVGVENGVATLVCFFKSLPGQLRAFVFLFVEVACVGQAAAVCQRLRFLLWEDAEFWKGYTQLYNTKLPTVPAIRSWDEFRKWLFHLDDQWTHAFRKYALHVDADHTQVFVDAGFIAGGLARHDNPEDVASFVEIILHLLSKYDATQVDHRNAALALVAVLSSRRDVFLLSHIDRITAMHENSMEEAMLDMSTLLLQQSLLQTVAPPISPRPARRPPPVCALFRGFTSKQRWGLVRGASLGDLGIELNLHSVEPPPETHRPSPYEEDFHALTVPETPSSSSICAPPLVASRDPWEPRRVASDLQAYTVAEFIAHYGAHWGIVKWHWCMPPGTQPDPRKYTILEEYHGEVEITVRFFNGATTNFRVPQSTLVNVVLEMAVEHFALRDPRSMLVHGTVWLHPMATLQELAICTGHILILTWR